MRHVGNAVPVLLAKAIAEHCAVLLGSATDEEQEGLGDEIGVQGS
jgi:hypothetical protein